MPTNRYSLGIVLTLSIAVFWTSSKTIHGQERLDWWSVNAHVARQLQTGERDLVEWASEWADNRPETPKAALVKINVSLRAALDEVALAGVRELKEFEANPSDSVLNGIYYDCCDQYEAWNVAKAVLETFAGQMSEVTVNNRLLKHFEQAGWSTDQIAQWLCRQEERARADAKPGKHELMAWGVFPSTPTRLWRQVRLRYLSRHDDARLKALLRKMAENVRGNPTDPDKAHGYLEALRETRGGGRELPELCWIVRSCRFEQATDWAAVGEQLQRLEQWSEAAQCFRKAIEKPLADDELERMGRMRQVTLSPKRLRVGFAVRLRERRARCLVNAGEPHAAQRLIEEIETLREEHDVPANPMLAGQVQAASGARVIEQRILEQEESSSDDPEYWRKRARYYRGRNEPKKEENAYKQGLQRAEAKPRPRGKSPSTLRASLLREYAGFLLRRQREDEAVDLLVAELKTAPIEAESSKAAARLLGFDLANHLDPEEPAIWDWLERRRKWEHTAERLLWRMLERTPPEARKAAYQRAEAMTRERHASRAATLGWILNRMNEPERSLPLLKYAVEHAEDKEERRAAAFTLFESYLDLGQWRAAEQMFNTASQRLTPSEDGEWLGRIAVLAARDGARDDAMRIFRRVANMTLRTSVTDRLAELGLRDRLAEYYAHVADRLPDSSTLDAIREELEQK